MVTISFAIPLDDQSKQTGDITLESIYKNGVATEFRLTNTTSCEGDKLDIITCKGEIVKHHEFNLSFSDNAARTTLSIEDIRTIWQDADGGDWDYIESCWSVGAVHQPNPSQQFELQTFNSNGWPPIS